MASGSKAAHERRGKADCGEYREAAEQVFNVLNY
jgi:hypothetical protein